MSIGWNRMAGFPTGLRPSAASPWEPLIGAWHAGGVLKTIFPAGEAGSYGISQEPSGQYEFSSTSPSPEVAVHLLRQRIQIEVLQRRVEKLEQCRQGSVTAPITFLPDETLELLRHIPAVMQPSDDDCYLATFFDANINASGETPQEALLNLSQMICSKFHLYRRKLTVLSPNLLRDFAILQKFVGERS
jgi:hypothetical protein